MIDPSKLLGRLHTERSTCQLRHAAAELWPYLTDTATINRRTGYDPVTYTFEPQERGGSRLLAASRLGGMRTRFEERPFEWVQPRWTRVERIFARGPLRYLRFDLSLEDTPRGCLATLAISWVARPFFALVARSQIRSKIRANFRVYHEFDAALDKRKGFDVRVLGAPSRPNAPSPERLTRELQVLAPSSNVPAVLARYLIETPDSYLSRMRPNEIARLCGLDRQETLRFFLLAVKEGYLDMSWDLLCPGCRGAKGRSAHLSEVRTEAHCEACNISFGVDLAANIELTFQPTARVFPIQKTLYCAGGPHATRHLRAQLTLEPGERRRETVELEPGPYRLRGPTLSGSLDFQVGPGGADNLTAVLDGKLAAKGTAVAPTVTLDLHNPGAEVCTVKLEHLFWRDDAVTAEYVTTLQDFRDLFGAEALRPGVELGVSNLVFFFSDLKGSTMLYDRHGDSRAFGLVQDHFGVMTEVIRAHGGGIVKTIGDAVMATFTDPAEAMRACLDIQERFARIADGSPVDFRAVVKIGLHRGAAIALTLNERFDYFGATVNKAARVQNESKGGDIVLTEELVNMPEVRSVLAGSGLRITRFQRELKGISGSAVLYRVHGRPASDPDREA